MSTRKFGTNETLVAVALVVLCVVISLVNPVFASWDNVFGLLRSAIVPCLLALGVLVVIISGGIDVSFTAVAVVALYVTVKLSTFAAFEAPIWLLFVVAAVSGLLLGLINAVLIARLRLPALIVTLGTLSLFRGLLLFGVGTDVIRAIPAAMTSFSRSNLVTTATAGGGTAGLHTGLLLAVAMVILVWLVLNYTMLGRGVYALGGDADAAHRTGFDVSRIQYAIYLFVGMLSGIAGLMHGVMVRQASPFDLVGTELDVIAAVVIGGAQLTGGRGTITGTLLGVALVVVMNNSLILLGVPSTWQKVVVGVIILLGTGLPAYQQRRARVSGTARKSAAI